MCSVTFQRQKKILSVEGGRSVKDSQENFYVTPCFSHDYHLTVVEYIKPQNTESACTTREKETDRDTFFFVQKNDSFEIFPLFSCWVDCGCLAYRHACWWIQGREVSEPNTSEHTTLVKICLGMDQASVQ